MPSVQSLNILNRFVKTLASRRSLQAFLIAACLGWAVAHPPIKAIAQTLAAPQVTRQGNQISFNGQTWPAIWAQWQLGTESRTGVADAGLMQRLGIELLKTRSASSQPVRWFSDPTSAPLELPVQFINRQYRYLDVSELASRFGWQLQVSGSTLQITAPVARVEAIRQGRHSWGDRLVFDLNRAASWQVQTASLQLAPEAEDPNPDREKTGPQKPPEPMQEVTVTVDADLSSSPTAGTSETSLPLPETNLTATVKTSPNQTTLSIRLPASWRPRIWTQPNPSRLIVDIRPDSQTERDILWAPGLRWRQKVVSLGSEQFPIAWLEIEPRQSAIALRPIWSDPSGMAGISPLAETAERQGAAAAINGGFFNRNNQLPLGAIRRDGRWLSSPILNRGAIAWNDSGDFKIGRLALQETLIGAGGRSWPVLVLNSGYVQAGISRYTSEWGADYIPLSNDETVLAVQDGQIAQQWPGGEAGKTAFPIPANGYLLVVRNSPGIAESLPVGTSLRLDSATVPGDFASYPHVLGAGPVLLLNGQIVLDARDEKFNQNFVEGKASRSAIGRTPAGTIIIAAVHNRTAGPGPTLTEMAQILQQLGAADALNLDGGGSTTLYLGGQLLEHPPRIVPRVHNGIGVFLQPAQ